MCCQNDPAYFGTFNSYVVMARTMTPFYDDNGTRLAVFQTVLLLAAEQESRRLLEWYNLPELETTKRPELESFCPSLFVPPI
jgi:hypothetical protein